METSEPTVGVEGTGNAVTTRREENVLPAATAQERSMTGCSSLEIAPSKPEVVDLTAEIGSSLEPAPGFGNKFSQDTVRLVVFKLAGHEHALDVHGVKEIMMATQISPVIEAPDFVEGVIKLRGRIVPVVDLRKRLQLPAAPKTYETCIIIVRYKKRLVGLLVDSASELLKIPVKTIEVPDSMIGGVRTRFMDGVVYQDNRLLVILNLEAILDINERELPGRAAQRNGAKTKEESVSLEPGKSLLPPAEKAAAYGE